MFCAFQGIVIIDVGVFELYSQLIEMLIDEKLSANLIFDKVPIIKFVKNYFHSGIYPSGSQRNFDSVKDIISFEDQDEALLLADAQTSGGLLISAPAETDIDLIEIEKIYGVSVKEIGNITDRYNQKINIISS